MGADSRYSLGPAQRQRVIRPPTQRLPGGQVPPQNSTPPHVKPVVDVVVDEVEVEVVLELVDVVELVVVLVLLLLVLLPLLLRRCDTAGCYRRVRAVAPLLLAAAALSELARLSALPPNDWTILAAQQRMRPLVDPGEVVLGDNAAIVLQTARVRTVRRVVAGARYSSPRPNADVADRLQPRYVLDYAAPELREFADVTASGFTVIGEVGLLREAAGMHRFELQLWRRR